MPFVSLQTCGPGKRGETNARVSGALGGEEAEAREKANLEKGAHITHRAQKKKNDFSTFFRTPARKRRGRENDLNPETPYTWQLLRPTAHAIWNGDRFDRFNRFDETPRGRRPDQRP